MIKPGHTGNMNTFGLPIALKQNGPEHMQRLSQSLGCDRRRGINNVLQITEVPAFDLGMIQ